MEVDQWLGIDVRLWVEMVTKLCAKEAKNKAAIFGGLTPINAASVLIGSVRQLAAPGGWHSQANPHGE